MGDPANNDFIPNSLRQRSHKREKSPKQPNGDNQAKNEVVWGKTPGGKGAVPYFSRADAVF
jgi:hypothetical protein